MSDNGKLINFPVMEDRMKELRASFEVISNENLKEELIRNCTVNIATDHLAERMNVPDSENLNYLDLKKTVKEIGENMEMLKRELEKELSNAALNGMQPETGDRIVELQRRIEQQTKMSAKNLGEITRIEQDIKEQASSRLDAVKTKVSGEMNKVKNNLVDKAVSGVAAMGAIKDKVHMANNDVRERANVSKDTIYINMEESVHQIGRNWMAFNYSRDRMIADTLDKVADTMEKAFEKGSNIKEAFKDLGRAITGKERLNEKGTLSPVQAALIGKIRDISASVKEEMKSLEKDFNRSKSISIQNIKSAMEYRESSPSNVKESGSLKKRFEQAKEESISSKTDLGGKDKKLVQDEKHKEEVL